MSPKKAGVRLLTSRPPKPRGSPKREAAAIPKRRIPFELGIAGLSLQLLCQSLIIATVAILWGVSWSRTGIPVTATLVTADSSSANGSARPWGYAVLWTTVPSTFIALYAKFYEAMVVKLKSCQPMVELLDPPRRRRSKPKGRQRRGEAEGPATNPSTTKLTLLLDYNRYLPLQDVWHAIRNRHFLLATCLLTNLALVLASSLAAAVLSLQSVTVNDTTDVFLTGFFDEFAPVGRSLLPSFDAVSASLIGGASSGPWTTPQYSFNPFAAVDLPSRPGNLTATTLAYYSTVDCAVMVPGVVEISVATGTAGDVTAKYTFNDRGCQVTQEWTMNSIPQFAQAWVTTNCSSSGAAGDVRIGLLAGQHNSAFPTGLTNSTLLSCIPTLWNATAIVTTASNTTRPGQLLDFALSSPIAFQPFFWAILLEDLPLYSSVDLGAEYYMDRFANLVYSVSAKRDPGNPFDSSAMLWAFSTVLKALTASFMSQRAYKANVAPTVRTQGVFSFFETRLFVIPGPAIAVLVIVFLALVSILWACVYVSRRQAILEREVKYMLGHADLASPGVAEFIEAARQSAAGGLGGTAPEKSDLVEYAARDPALNSWECWIDKTDNKIRVRQGVQDL